MVLKIRKSHLNEIFQVARKNYPYEACGILVGRVYGTERIVEKVYHTKNVLASSSAYRIDAAEQLRIFEEAELQNLDIIGFYHSHPFWDSFWSEEDEAKSDLWKGYLYLIISLKTGKINGYVKRNSRVDAETVIPT